MKKAIIYTIITLICMALLYFAMGFVSNEGYDCRSWSDMSQAIFLCCVFQLPVIIYLIGQKHLK